MLKKNFFKENDFAKDLKPSEFLNDEAKSEFHDGKYTGGGARIDREADLFHKRGTVSDSERAEIRR